MTPTLSGLVARLYSAPAVIELLVTLSVYFSIHRWTSVYVPSRYGERAPLRPASTSWASHEFPCTPVPGGDPYPRRRGATNHVPQRLRRSQQAFPLRGREGSSSVCLVGLGDQGRSHSVPSRPL